MTYRHVISCFTNVSNHNYGRCLGFGLKVRLGYRYFGNNHNTRYYPSTYQLRERNYEVSSCYKHTFNPVSYSNWLTLMCSRYSINVKSDSKSKVSKFENKTQADKKSKKEVKTYITLLKEDNSMQVTTVEEASKLASRRNYKLVKTKDFDSKAGRAVYKLVTESQYIKEDREWLGQETTLKQQRLTKYKVISISSNINEHDVITKIKLMKKWLQKHSEVRVVISGENNLGENIYQLIENGMGEDGRILQKRRKDNDIRFQIIPIKKSGTTKVDESNS